MAFLMSGAAMELKWALKTCCPEIGVILCRVFAMTCAALPSSAVLAAPDRCKQGQVGRHLKADVLALPITVQPEGVHVRRC